MSKTKKRHPNRRAGPAGRRSPYGRRGTDPAIWLGSAAAAIVVLLLAGMWQSGAFAAAPAPSRDGDPSDLLPMAAAGYPLSGGHDMARIPEQTPASQPVPPGEPVARVDLPGTSHDFGRVYESWDVTHVFAVQNTGDADLIISNLVTSCGCTTAELTGNVVPPGQRADLTVTFDAGFHEANGEVTRLVWFATNDPAQPWVELRIIANVR